MVAVWGSIAVRAAKSTAPTVAVPNAAPTERENCTEAAADPSILGPATIWTVV